MAALIKTLLREAKKRAQIPIQDNDHSGAQKRKYEIGLCPRFLRRSPTISFFAKNKPSTFMSDALHMQPLILGL
jgi:hypothetical protein